MLYCFQQATAVHLFEHPQSDPEGDLLVCQDMLDLAPRLAYGELCILNAIMGLRSVILTKSVTEYLLPADVILTPVVQRINLHHPLDNSKVFVI